MMRLYKLRYLKRLFITLFESKSILTPSICVDVKKLCVIYSIPTDSPRLKTWNDGFVNAISLISNNMEVSWKNIEVDSLVESELNSFDFLIVKSNWNWGPDLILRTKFKNLKVKKGLAISGVSIPPSLDQMCYYDVLWYETKWYKKLIRNHPNIFHAFGINKNVLVPKEFNIKYDYISIGAFLPHKRMHLIKKLKGRVLVIGEEYSTEISNRIVKEVSELENVTVMPFVKYEDLSLYFSYAKCLYIPAAIDGGGERAILEARYCGLDVLVEKDNKKLKELCFSEIYDSNYYCFQLLKGIESCNYVS